MVDGCRQCRIWDEDEGHSQTRSKAESWALSPHGATLTIQGQLHPSAFRRNASACGLGAGAGYRARCSADGRAVCRPRRADSRPVARRIGTDLGRDWAHDHFCHAQRTRSRSPRRPRCPTDISSGPDQARVCRRSSSSATDRGCSCAGAAREILGELREEINKSLEQEYKAP